MSFDCILENAMASADITQNDLSLDVHHQGTVQYINYHQGINQPDQSNDYNHESLRYFSLISWINKHVSKEKLARYGFYYNLEKDYVKCYFCEVVIGEWGVGDDPLTEHHKHSPFCEFINMKPTDNVPIGDELTLRNELKAIQGSLQTGKRGVAKFNVDLIPRHPDYKDEEARLQSFVTWPKYMRQTPRDLSVAGFFYLGVGDEVKCFFCGGCLKDWEDIDTPLEEHKKHFYVQCQFIKKNYTELRRNNSKQNSKNLVKATPAQIGELTKYMSENSDLKDGKINLGSNKSQYNRMWQILSDNLNNMEGPRKNTKAWKEVWRNHKYNSKRKESANSSPKSDRTDHEIPYKKFKMYHDYEEIQNKSTVEADSTDRTIPKIEVNHTNAIVSTSTGMITEYQSNFENSYNTRMPMMNKNFELELQKQQCENELLQFELLKLKHEIEKRQLQNQIDAAKQELERNRMQTDNGLSYFQLL